MNKFIILNTFNRCIYFSVILVLIISKNSFSIEHPKVKLNKEERWENAIKSISKYEEEIRLDPCYIEGSYLFEPQGDRLIFELIREDTSFITKGKIFEMYNYVIENSKNIDVLLYAMYSLIDIGVTYNRIGNVMPILKKALEHESLNLRVLTANTLFSKGYKDKAYPIYIEIINMKPNELEKNLNSMIIPHSILLCQKDTLNDKQKQESQNQISNWRISPIINTISYLLDYNDLKTNELVKKAIKNNYYIADLLAKYKSLKLKENWTYGIEKRKSFFNKLEKYQIEK